MSFKLYYTPTSCGAASWISAHIAGLKFDSEVVDLKTHKTASGADFYQTNPKGNVPTIVLSNGAILNENIATLSYVADQNPSAGLAPAAGSNERYQLLNELSFLATELHKGVGGLFSGKTEEKEKNAHNKLKYFNDNQVGKGQQFIVGNKLTIADIYAYIILSWTGYVGLSLDGYPNAKKFYEHIGSLDQVKNAQAALKAAH